MLLKVAERGRVQTCKSIYIQSEKSEIFLIKDTVTEHPAHPEHHIPSYEINSSVNICISI